MKHTSTATKQFYFFISPSWLSACISVMLGVCVEVAAVILALFGRPGINQDVFALHQETAGTLAEYHSILDNLSQYGFINELPLYLFWAGNGLVAYAIAVWAYRRVQASIQYHRELRYVHAHPATVLKESSIRLGIRVVAIIVGLIVFGFGIRQIIPYALAAAHSFAANLSLGNLLGVVLGMLAIAVTTSVLIACIRFVFFRARIFSA